MDVAQVANLASLICTRSRLDLCVCVLCVVQKRKGHNLVQASLAVPSAVGQTWSGLFLPPCWPTAFAFSLNYFLLEILTGRYQCIFFFFLLFPLLLIFVFKSLDSPHHPYAPFARHPFNQTRDILVGHALQHHTWTAPDNTLGQRR